MADVTQLERCPSCARRPIEPVPVCLITQRAPAARIVVRPTYGTSSYVGPGGTVYPPRPTAWPWAVVEPCPWCGATHTHSILTPARLWYRIPPCRGGRPYLVTIGAAA